MALIAGAAFLFSLPRFFEYKIDLSMPQYKFKLTDLLQSKVYTIAYRIISFFLFMYHVPITLLLILNFKLLYALHKADSYREAIRHKSGTKFGPKNNRSISIIVVTVVSICIVCNLSAMVSHLVWSLEEGYKQSGKFDHLDIYRRYLALISNIFVTFNAAVNFIIYCLCSRNFRATLSQCCRCCKTCSYKPRNRLNSLRKSSLTRTQLNGTYISLLNQTSSPNVAIRMKNLKDLNNATLS